MGENNNPNCYIKNELCSEAATALGSFAQNILLNQLLDFPIRSVLLGAIPIFIKQLPQ